MTPQIVLHSWKIGKGIRTRVLRPNQSLRHVRLYQNRDDASSSQAIRDFWGALLREPFLDSSKRFRRYGGFCARAAIHGIFSLHSILQLSYAWLTFARFCSIGYCQEPLQHSIFISTARRPLSVCKIVIRGNICRDHWLIENVQRWDSQAVEPKSRGQTSQSTAIFHQLACICALDHGDLVGRRESAPKRRHRCAAEVHSGIGSKQHSKLPSHRMQLSPWEVSCMANDLMPLHLVLCSWCHIR